MKSTRSALAGLLLTALAVPAFADEGTPANVAAAQAELRAAQAAQVARGSNAGAYVPQYLNVARGEDTLVENPAFVRGDVARQPFSNQAVAAAGDLVGDDGLPANVAAAQGHGGTDQATRFAARNRVPAR